MNKPIGIGIIGCGGIGAEHAKALAQVDGARMVACCETRADEYRRTYGASYATTDSDKLIHDPDVDVVYVLTQHDSHADLCIRSAQAGKHVLVEKPLALNVDDCLRVGRAVTRHGITLMPVVSLQPTAAA